MNNKHSDTFDVSELLNLNREEPKQNPEAQSRKPVILAVDDSAIILQAVSSTLGGDYKVYTLPKPTMIREILQKITPDLFLLDYMMPELTGFDLIPIIREYEQHKKTPIILLTSAGNIENVSSAVMLGACDFIVKPVHPDILRDKIHKHIMKKTLKNPDVF